MTGHNEQVTTQIPRARRSARATITVVPQFPPADPRATVTSDRGRPGAYSCTFVLSRPGAETYRSGIDIAAFMETGDSLLAVSQEVAGVSVTCFGFGRGRPGPRWGEASALEFVNGPEGSSCGEVEGGRRSGR